MEYARSSIVPVEKVMRDSGIDGKTSPAIIVASVSRTQYEGFKRTLFYVASVSRELSMRALSGPSFTWHPSAENAV